MNTSQPRHAVKLVPHEQLPIEMKDRTNGQGLDMLSMYDQDVLILLVFVVKEMLAVLECLNHFLLAELGQICWMKLCLLYPDWMPKNTVN